MLADTHDVIIIGGGPVGMALALGLRESGVSTLLLEARGLSEKNEDPRPLALSYGSRLLLQRLGIWGKISHNTPITSIHISNRGSLGRTVLTPEDAGVPALGYVVNYHDLYSSMREAMRECSLAYLTGAAVTRLETDEHPGNVYFEQDGSEKKVTARLIVLADGGHLAGQIKDITHHVHEYEQWAVVANVKAEVQQTGIAYERFTTDGPVALLPSQKDFALVWTVSSDAVKTIATLDDAAFLCRLHAHFGDRLGKFTHAGKRSSFPLSLKYATPIISQRVALIGNAAQTLHPVAGQGFNLGLRDAHELTREIITTSEQLNEIGTPAMLARYHQRRQIDSSTSRIFTDSLIKVFAHENSVFKQICGLGLSTLDCCPPLKRLVARQMIFGTRG
ncbi:MAG: FAD-dependent monooxygenase [Pseudomonadota bacterium]